MAGFELGSSVPEADALPLCEAGMEYSIKITPLSLPRYFGTKEDLQSHVCPVSVFRNLILSSKIRHFY
jgi:hypothetical protein